jgi:hypothetical protein
MQGTWRLHTTANPMTGEETVQPLLLATRGPRHAAQLPPFRGWGAACNHATSVDTYQQSAGHCFKQFVALHLCSSGSCMRKTPCALPLGQTACAQPICRPMQQPVGQQAVNKHQEHLLHKPGRMHVALLIPCDAKAA